MAILVENLVWNLHRYLNHLFQNSHDFHPNCQCSHVGQSPSRWFKRIIGDLSNIVIKSLVDPHREYLYPYVHINRFTSLGWHILTLMLVAYQDCIVCHIVAQKYLLQIFAMMFVPMTSIVRLLENKLSSIQWPTKFCCEFSL